jgi:hypothetical protein
VKSATVNSPKTLPSTELRMPKRLPPIVVAIVPKSTLSPPTPARIPSSVSDWLKWVLTNVSAESMSSGTRETSCESWSTSSEPNAAMKRITKSRTAIITRIVASPRFIRLASQLTGGALV